MNKTKRVFHKYRGDGDFTDAIVTESKVFLATADQLNDPFECSIVDISARWIASQVEASRSASLGGFIMEAVRSLKTGNFFGASRDEIQSTLSAIRLAPDIDAKWEAYRNFMVRHTDHPPTDPRRLYGRLDEQLVEIGIFSMSTDPANPLMWAHYGDEHRGVCFGFSADEKSKLADPEHCLQVIYSDQLPKMDEGGLCTVTAYSCDDEGKVYPSSFKVAFGDRTLQRVISTKAACWSYEAEVRYVEPFSGLCDLPGGLAECTFGLRCSDKRRRHYIDLLETHIPTSVALFEIKAVQGSNALERVPLNPAFTVSRATTCKPRIDGEPEKLTLDQFVARMAQLIQKENYGEVIFQTDANLLRHPDNPQYLHLKATAHGLAGEHQKAYDTYSRLSELFPHIAASFYGRACAAEALGQLDDVVPLLRRAAELNDEDASIALNLGIHLASSADTREEGMEQLRRAARLGHRRAGRIIRELEAQISNTNDQETP